MFSGVLLSFYGKLGTMEKTKVLWKNYGSIPKTMELWFNMKKNYGNTVNYT